MTNHAAPVNILIASPLEEEHVARIRAFAPGQINVIHEPELVGIPRYVADHVGTPRTLTLNSANAGRAICEQRTFSSISIVVARQNCPVSAPRLRWVAGHQLRHR